MKQFDLHRFTQVLKWHLVSNRREILNKFFGLAVAFFMLQLVSTQVVDTYEPALNADADYYANRVNNAMGGSFFFLLCCIIIQASTIFGNMKETRQRTSFLLLPASRLEKFLMRFLYIAVLLPLVASLALVVADVVRMLMATLWGRPLVSGVAMLFTSGGDPNAAASIDEVVVFFILAGYFLFTHAIYVLGGTLLRKNPFLLTTGLMFVMFFLLVHVLKWGVAIGVLNHVTALQYDSTGLHVHPMVYPFVVASYVLAVILYWLSYRVFCRMQVINNKWFNL